MNLRTVKWAQCDTTQLRELVKNCSSKCAYETTQSVNSCNGTLSGDHGVSEEDRIFSLKNKK